ncbi:RNA polymerase sigma factor [Baekduia sp. Peel2402]|uniref:RNA polymerase sigma factor n=1 Tax=Baekduia sp. Peel2402 TaxID=3458296 RepID=UPI00403EEFFE
MRDDSELLAGDAEAFGVFYARHEDAVLAFFLRRVRRPELAADLTAETFAAALRGRATHDPQRGEARAWLFGIARNVLLASLRRGRVEDDARRRLGMERLVLDDVALARVEELANASALTALDDLPPDQRAAVAGRVVEERSYEELAAALQCSESVVRQRVSRGLRTLRTRLEGRGA